MSNPIVTPIMSLLRSRAVMVAALALLINVSAAVACPDGLYTESCDVRVPLILDSVNTFGLAVIAKMAVEDVAQKLSGQRLFSIQARPPAEPSEPSAKSPSS